MIVAHGLSKQYGQVRAVDNLSFTVQPGVVTGFLGPNGAGKSTTMRLMLGLDRGQGNTKFNGRTYAELDDPARAVGVLLDAKAVHPGRTARSHLRMIAAGAGIPARRADEVLDMVGLGGAAKRRAGGFSLGMSQRLGLAAALLGNPPVLMLDEPANGLDPEGVRWLRDLLKSLAAEGRTIFVSSHLLNEMTHLADALIVIGGGRLIAAESLPEFVKRHARVQVVARADHPAALIDALMHAGYRSTPQPDGAVIVEGVDTDTVAAIASRARVYLRELSSVQTSLEEAFFAATSNAAQYRAN
ncbi:ATP-binding cassette domain-containing protein [Lentzea tibetensis]|uniref:ATP-binding cassette domain-containing protein n=1 Tax=Lentzea tibetensis TaxID=2591470 RepID=A0A563EFT0_9PSEU|nr:ATP-binding cassette domain-containing protein [Lentzea tibetensis]TWP44943.1 ATP-binding cassette domain-containing protein [Lentzea tibetensis]